MQVVNATKPIIDAIERLESKFSIKFKQLWEADFADGIYPRNYGTDPICFRIEIVSIESVVVGITIASSTTNGCCYFEHDGNEWLVEFSDIEKEFQQLMEQRGNSHILRGWKLKDLLKGI